ncbi:MAG: hypothetical protein OXL95_05205 [Nitrospira sp.]|nr:hypothetical protein [Nitrospira sp.]
MSPLSQQDAAVYRLSSRVHVVPIRHGSADVARAVRDLWLKQRFDCVALPLPTSVENPVEEGVRQLPVVSVVVMPEPDRDERPVCSYVPLDPCQPVIATIRTAMEEGIERAYIDRDVTAYDPTEYPAPDPYALKSVSLAAFSGAALPFLPYPKPHSQRWSRIKWMAFKLHELELDYHSILCICAVEDWPWLRDAYQNRWPYEVPERLEGRPALHQVEPRTLYFLLCELPFLTELVERRRIEARSDAQLSVDGIKELLLETRLRWLATRPAHLQQESNWVTPQLLQMYLQYVRNLALGERRLTPDLYTVALAAKQFAGDEFAATLLETAKSYEYEPDESLRAVSPPFSVGLGLLESSEGVVFAAKDRLRSTSPAWRTLSLKPRHDPRRRRQWAYHWNPLGQCSWPPEDNRIEGFTAHVREQSKALLGEDLARVDKFTTSIRDGIDVRETLRHWDPRKKVVDLYVKELPPSRGTVEIVVFIFEVPADPEKFSWQATWYAEHVEESTLCFYATPFLENMTGPGIGQSQYGGTLFLFPPRPIPDIWDDPRLDFARTLEERLIAGAALHSREKHITLVSPVPPLARWRHIARKFERRFIPVSLSRFSGQTVARLRRFHVLNGHEIRSFAGQFIQE